MKTLQDYIVDDRLYVSDTGPEAQVGDQAKLFLDQASNPAFPEFIFGIIQHPIVRINCDSSTSYVIEYDEADLEGAASLIRPSDITDVTLVSAVDVLAVELGEEVVARTAADVVLQDAIDDEEAARTAGDVALQASIDAETAARIAGDTSLQAGITEEEERALEAESLLAPKDSPTFTGFPKLPSYTAAGLGSAVTAGVGSKAFCSDANATTFHAIVAGAGANFVPVFSDGTNWRIG